MKKITVSIIGSGNVATSIASKLHACDVKIEMVYSKKMDNAKLLASKVEAIAVDSISSINSTVDFIIIAVKDEAIKAVVSGLPVESSVVHTSGSIGLDVLSKFENSGILYPLQTFSKAKIIDIEGIPFFIEANSDQFLEKINAFTINNLSSRVHSADSELRSVIHLAAVFANNFSTQLMAESTKILSEKGLDISILKPLMMETFSKIFDFGAENALTGPAKRGDQAVIDHQISMLEDQDLLDLYRIFTKLIQKQH